MALEPTREEVLRLVEELGWKPMPKGKLESAELEAPLRAAGYQAALYTLARLERPPLVERRWDWEEHVEDCALLRIDTVAGPLYLGCPIPFLGLEFDLDWLRDYYSYPPFRSYLRAIDHFLAGRLKLAAAAASQLRAFQAIADQAHILLALVEMRQAPWDRALATLQEVRRPGAAQIAAYNRARLCLALRKFEAAETILQNLDFLDSERLLAGLKKRPRPAGYPQQHPALGLVCQPAEIAFPGPPMPGARSPAEAMRAVGDPPAIWLSALRESEGDLVEAVRVLELEEDTARIVHHLLPAVEANQREVVWSPPRADQAVVPAMREALVRLVRQLAEHTELRGSRERLEWLARCFAWFPHPERTYGAGVTALFEERLPQASLAFELSLLSESDPERTAWTELALARIYRLLGLAEPSHEARCRARRRAEKMPASFATTATVEEFEYTLRFGRDLSFAQSLLSALGNRASLTLASHLLAGNPSKARRALGLARHSDLKLLLEVRCLLGMGEPEEALSKAAELALRIPRWPALAITRARALLLVAEPELARQVCLEALEHHPNHVRLLALTGQTGAFARLRPDCSPEQLLATPDPLGDCGPCWPPGEL